jgi:hypothetical protein
MEFVRNINWELLRKQKATLLNLIQTVDNTEQIEDLQGVIYLIDAVQDEAVDNEGTEETLVFGN